MLILLAVSALQRTAVNVSFSHFLNLPHYSLLSFLHHAPPFPWWFINTITPHHYRHFFMCWSMGLRFFSVRAWVSYNSPLMHNTLYRPPYLPAEQGGIEDQG